MRWPFPFRRRTTPEQSHMRSSQDDPALSAQECQARADAAAGQERWVEALRWVRAAKERGPLNEGLLIDEGHYLSQIGQFEDALASFLAADQLAKEGCAALRAADAAWQASQPLNEVLALVSRALEKTPGLVDSLPSHGHFGMEGTPDYDRVVERALARAARMHDESGREA